MPLTRESHIEYTNNELNTYEYYIKIFEYLKEKQIQNYLDIGANIGEFCNVLFEKIPSLKMAYLVEVEENNFQFMLKHVKYKNVLCINYGIGYGFKNPNVVIDSYQNVGGFRIVEGTDSSIRERIKTLEQLVEELKLPAIDFVKIDIEGGEYNIIENSKFLQTIKFIDIEFHGKEKELNFIENYVKIHFPNHKIVKIDELNVRCLLENEI